MKSTKLLHGAALPPKASLLSSSPHLEKQKHAWEHCHHGYDDSPHTPPNTYHRGTTEGDIILNKKKILKKKNESKNIGKTSKYFIIENVPRSWFKVQLKSPTPTPQIS